MAQVIMAQVKWHAGNNGSGLKGTNRKSLAGEIWFTGVYKFS